MTSRRGLAVRLAIGGLALAAAIAFLWIYRITTGSLPDLDGETELSGLGAEVVVERDASGVPTVRGRIGTDVTRALGFVHAQERFFQMDLLRRRAAGELAELLGPAALSADRRHRLHRMRHRARGVVSATGPQERETLSAYVAGVNAGLEALESPPFEYLLLRSEPRGWEPEDSVLVVMSMFFELNDDGGELESARDLVHDVLPPELAAFLTPSGSEWDAPLWGEPLSIAPIPGASILDLRSRKIAPIPTATLDFEDELVLGSNNWAVAGSKTSHRGALLANDMHLGHSMPNIWFRALLITGERRLAGVTLPGTPGLVAGTNGDIAWGFTNTGGDWVDLVEIENNPRGYELHRETIRVRGGAPVELEIKETAWGPVIDEDHRGRLRAVHWIAHDPSGVNLKLGLMEEARTAAEALALAPFLGIPPQNFVVADREGSIGWTVAGRIPSRSEAPWTSFLSAEEYPRVLNPPSGILWTANARVVSGDMFEKMGDGGYTLGARAMQIRDNLLALETASEKDMLAIQLDDRALFLSRWRGLFAELVEDRPEHAELKAVLGEGWTGRASIDSAGYRAVKHLRRAVFEEVFGVLTESARKTDPRFHVGLLRQWEGPLWKLVSEKPAHLVPAPYRSWDEWLLDIVSRTSATWARPLSERTWGEANTSAIRHPLSATLPFLSRFLDAEPKPLPGDIDMPRVQGPSAGASERLVVSPGREEEAIFEMPSGQSGHPLSPYYRSGHEDWEEGRPSPLLPGEARFRLTLRP